MPLEEEGGGGEELGNNGENSVKKHGWKFVMNYTLFMRNIYFCMFLTCRAHHPILGPARQTRKKSWKIFRQNWLVYEGSII